MTEEMLHKLFSAAASAAAVRKAHEQNQEAADLDESRSKSILYSEV